MKRIKKSKKKSKLFNRQNKKINFKIIKITNTGKENTDYKESNTDQHIDPYIEYLNNIKTI